MPSGQVLVPVAITGTVLGAGSNLGWVIKQVTHMLKVIRFIFLK